MGAFFGTTAESSTSTSTRNSPFAVSGQGVGFYLERNSRNESDNIRIGKGGSYEVNYYTLNGQGDDGLDQAIAERVQNQVRAGGDRAVDEIKTMSPSNILQIALWGLLGLAAFAVVKPMLGGSKS